MLKDRNIAVRASLIFKEKNTYVLPTDANYHILGFPLSFTVPTLPLPITRPNAQQNLELQVDLMGVLPRD